MTGPKVGDCLTPGEVTLIRPSSFFKYMNHDGGMPYAPGMPSFAEPTLLMILACISAEETAAAEPLIDWALKSRNADGSIGLNQEFRREGLWNTPLLAIAMHRLGRQAERDSAIEFLLRYRSIAVAKDPANDLDTSLIGWPWVTATFAWVEPTAWALMALRLAGKDQHPRAIEGRRILADRCMPGGGWDYGNKVVFGHTLIPFWDSTALALLALDAEDNDVVDKSLNLLEGSLADIPSLYSLSLVCLSLLRLGRNIDGLRAQIGRLLAKPTGEDLNLAHSALGCIALSGKRILTP